jgi:hypothetical protein
VYDTFLRPYLPDPVTGAAGEGEDVKGKGKEKAETPGGGGGPKSIGITLGGVRIGEVDKPKKLKMEKQYSHIIQDIPGALPLAFVLFRVALQLTSLASTYRAQHHQEGSLHPRSGAQP